MASNTAVPPTTFGLRLRQSEVEFRPPVRRVMIRGNDFKVKCCCSGEVVPIRRIGSGSGRKGGNNGVEWPVETTHKVRVQPSPALPFASSSK